MAAEPTRRIKARIQLCAHPCFPSRGGGWKRGFSWPSRRRTGTRTRCTSDTAAERNENPRAAVGCECEIAGNGFARPTVSDSGEVVPEAVGRGRYGATTRRQLRGAVTCCKNQVEISLGPNWRSHVRRLELATGLGACSRWGVLLVRTGNAASLRKKSGATTDKAWGRDLLPELTEVHRWSDRKKTVTIPLFAGYAFVKLDRSRASRLRVLQTPGVIGFLSSQGKAAPVPAEQVEHLRKLLRENVPCSLHAFLRAGQRVRVRGGCLDGVEGIYVDADSKKLIVSIDCLQRSVAVRVEGYKLELV
jgi:transcription antitermination factor NusG